MNNEEGFSLLELLLVIIILGVLATLVSGNYINTLKKGRDVRRKNDLANVQRALEIYYEDKKTYPTAIPFDAKFCETALCDSSEVVYMQKVPDDPRSANNYVFDSTDGTYYKLYSCIENENDEGEGVSQSGYALTDCGPCQSDNLCKYGTSSSNTTP